MKTTRYELIAKGVATIYAEDAQQIADEYLAYLAEKNGEVVPQAAIDAAAWVAGDRNYYDLIKIGA